MALSFVAQNAGRLVVFLNNYLLCCEGDFKRSLRLCDKTRVGFKETFGRSHDEDLLTDRRITRVCQRKFENECDDSNKGYWAGLIYGAT